MTKTQMTALLGSLMLTGTTFAGTAAATGKTVVPPMPSADELLGFTLTAGWDSTYLFHGVDVGDNWLWSKLDYNLALNDKLSFNLGAFYGHLFDYTYNELDVYGGLTYNAGPVNIGAGFTWYHYFDGSTLENQYEPYLSVSSNGLPVDVYFTGYYDFEVDGTYLETGLSKTIKLCESASLVPSVNVGYNLGYNTDEDGWNHVGVRLALPITLSKTATLTPYIAGNFALDATEGFFAEDNVFLGGISLSVKF
jgi:hypothetical protein